MYDTKGPIPSFKAGESFGQLIAKNYKLTTEELLSFVAELRPKYPLLISHYKEGFVSGYRLYSVKYLTKQENKDMALVVKDYNKNEDFKDERDVVWVKPGDLAENDIVFQIDRITKAPYKGTKKDEKGKWYVTISGVRNLPDDTDLDLEVDEETEKIMFSLTMGRRDVDMEAATELIKEKGPMYNVYVQKNVYDRGYSEFELCILDKKDKLFVVPPQPEEQEDEDYGYEEEEEEARYKSQHRRSTKEASKTQTKSLASSKSPRQKTTIKDEALTKAENKSRERASKATRTPSKERRPRTFQHSAEFDPFELP